MIDALTKLVATATAPDAMNSVNAWLYALSKDTPAKAWWHAEAMHPAIFRALKLSRTDDGAIYAAMPFRLARDAEGNHCILVALPTPKFFEADDDWLGIDTVLAWYPGRDVVANLYDDAPDQLIGEAAGDAAHLFASPFGFFRAMAETRAQWVTRFLANADKAWRRKPSEPRHIPGLLLIGDAGKVRWPRNLPAELHCHGIDPRAVNRAVLRQSNLPRAIAAHDLRSAA